MLDGSQMSKNISEFRILRRLLKSFSPKKQQQITKRRIIIIIIIIISYQ